MDALTAIYDFIIDVLNALGDLVLWIGDLATLINDVSFDGGSNLNLLIGTYRYLVSSPGEPVWMATIIGMYAGLFFMALRVIPIFISWWKKISPFN